MVRLRSAPSAQVSPPPKAQTKRQALKEKTNSTRSQARVFEDDGNIEDLVKDAKRRRGRPRKSAHDDQDLLMAGGLGQKRAGETIAISTHERAKSDAPPPPTAKANRRPPRMTRKVVQSEAQSKVLDGLKKRMEETAREEAGQDSAVPTTMRGAKSVVGLTAKVATARKSVEAAQERSEYDISPSPPPSDKLGSVERSSLAQPTSVLRPHGSPAMDTSVLKNFRRRPRQLSMLALVEQKLAGARHSVANAAAADEDPTIYDFDDGDEEDEDDFAPEAEGTPFRASKAKRKSTGSSTRKQPGKSPAVKSAAKPRKRKSDEADVSLGALDALRSKRQKTDAPAPVVEDEDPLPELEREPSIRGPSTETARLPTPQPQATSDVQVINSSQSSPPPAEPEADSAGARPAAFDDDDFVVPSTEEQQAEVQVEGEGEDEDEDELADDPLQGAPNGTMAEPASSSPAPIMPSATQQRLRDELADPLTQVSPQPTKARPARKEKGKPMSTATLQSLLPKRRQPLKPRHRKSEYDFTLQSEDEDELEASRFEEEEEDEGDENRGRPRRQTKVIPTHGRKNIAAPKTTKARQSKAAKSSRKGPTQPPIARKSLTAAGSKKPTKTYGRSTNATSDKENAGADADGDGDGDGFETLDEGDSADLPETTAHGAAHSGELEAAKRKFAEVDEWDMEFESLGDEEHRSSSQQWR